jgi:hypothetical protein
MNTLQVPGALDVSKFALLETFAISHNKLPVMAAATSAPGLGTPRPHLLHRDWALSCHIFTGTGLPSAPGLDSPPATAAPGLGSFPPHLHGD